MTLETTSSEFHWLRSRGTTCGEAPGVQKWTVGSGGHGAELSSVLRTSLGEGGSERAGGWQCDTAGRGASHDTPPAGRGTPWPLNHSHQAEGPRPSGCRFWGDTGPLSPRRGRVICTHVCVWRIQCWGKGRQKGCQDPTIRLAWHHHSSLGL